MRVYSSHHLRAATRIKSRVDSKSLDYMTHGCRRPFTVLTMREQSRRMEAPRVRIDPSAASPQPGSYVAHVSWEPYDDDGGGTVLGYKLQMRENEGTCKWKTVAACLSGNEVKKKNLTSRKGYMFRVRPVIRGEGGGSESNLDMSVHEGGTVVPFSTASTVVGERRERSSSSSPSNAELIKLFRKLPNDLLLDRGGMSKCKVQEAFSNADLVFLYAAQYSSSTCKRYTPNLIKFYNESRAMRKAAPTRTKSVEIVYISSDSSRSDFKAFYSTMPWLAVPHDAETRDRILSWMKCRSVPTLMCLDGRTGKILESNSYGRALDLSRFTKLFKEGTGMRLGLI